MKTCLLASALAFARAVLPTAHAAAPNESAYFYMDESEKRLGQTRHHQLIKIIIDKLDTSAFDAMRKRVSLRVL